MHAALAVNLALSSLEHDCSRCIIQYLPSVDFRDGWTIGIPTCSKFHVKIGTEVVGGADGLRVATSVGLGGFFLPAGAMYVTHAAGATPAHEGRPIII